TRRSSDLYFSYVLSFTRSPFYPAISCISLLDVFPNVVQSLGSAHILKCSKLEPLTINHLITDWRTVEGGSIYRFYNPFNRRMKNCEQCPPVLLSLNSANEEPLTVPMYVFFT